METVVRNVKDLDAGKRRACEDLLGHELSDDQRLIIHVLSPESIRESGDRDRALDRLRQIAERARQNVARSGLSEEEIGQIIDEAVAAVRSGKA